MAVFFPVITYNPDTEQLRDWYRNNRGTPEFLEALEVELLWRAEVAKRESEDE